MKEGDTFLFDFNGSQNEFIILLFNTIKSTFNMNLDEVKCWAYDLLKLNHQYLTILIIESRLGCKIAIVEPHCARVFPLELIEILTQSTNNHHLSIF